ncbi:hypothetical protein [Kribbella sp. CA-293567]|uniref:hypothetical protein n=1 Tax=Kribbella sp. CA-293567 TaxID=3002436 RepID=UPI0022DD3277|nr:hypothetical protein [Kribbella sp. CA-293567]WBQ05195.1 hypothetical protein OX958_35265 [Kribbella sp. CA-293567]
MFRQGRLRLRAAAIVGVAGVLTFGAAVTPAAAADSWSVGTKVSGPGGACNYAFVANNAVKVCFEPDGELLYVYDGKSDGRSAIGEVSFSHKGCRNKWGKGTWARCNYSWPEGKKAFIIGGTRDFEGVFNTVRDITGEGSVRT